MPDNLPEPFVPPEVDLRGLEWMPYYGDRLSRSLFNAHCSDAVYRAAHNLWWSAWNQIPAASLPNDEVSLCRLADLGRSLKTFRKLREEVMRGFVLCADGRFYHKFLSEVAKISWEKRLNERARKKRWRESRQLDQPVNVVGPGDITVAEPLIRQDKTGQDLKKKKEEGSPDGDPSIGAPAPSEAPVKIRGGSRGTRWPAGQLVPDEWKWEAHNVRVQANLPDIDVEFEASAFSDYWASKSGSSATKVDWHLTWKSWVRNSRRVINGKSGDDLFGQGDPAGRGRGGPPASPFLAAMFDRKIAGGHR